MTEFSGIAPNFISSEFCKACEHAGGVNLLISLYLRLDPIKPIARRKRPSIPTSPATGAWLNSRKQGLVCTNYELVSGKN